MLTQARHCLRNPEHAAHDIMTRIAQIPQLRQPFHCRFDARLPTRFDYRLHFHWMWGVDNTKDVLARHKSEARKSRLEVVDSLPHVTLGRENERSDSIIRIFYPLSFTDLHQARNDLRICQAGVAENGTAGLKGLDDLVGGIAREREAGC